MSNEKGGSAFPDFKQEGMTLRDYFAAKAMQSLIVSSLNSTKNLADLPCVCYMLADAMLAERAK